MSGLTGLIAHLEEVQGSGTWVRADCRHTNSVGTPIFSSTANDTGEAIPGVYNLTFASVIAGTSATVTVTPTRSKNPYARNKAVSLDSTTVYNDVIGGVSLVFSNSGSFTGSWTAQVRIGYDHGNLNSYLPDSATPGTQRRIRVVNTGADTAEDCHATLRLNGTDLSSLVISYVKTGTVFTRIREFAEAATMKLTGTHCEPYLFEVSSVSGSGSSKTMTVKIDTATFNVQNLTTGGTGTSTGLNVNDFYEITSGGCIGVQFRLSSAAVNSDAVNVLIFDSRFVQIAPDLDGAPGNWGTDDVVLTEDGLEEGQISASGFAYYWERPLVPTGSASDSNPYPMSAALVGTVGTAAGWSS